MQKQKHWFTSYLTEKYSKNKKLGLDIGCRQRPYHNSFECNYVGLDLPKHDTIKEKIHPDIFADGTVLPFKDDTFDLITSYSVVPYVKQVDNLFNEMHRVMKPNGIAVIIIMNLRGLALDPDGYYPTRFNSKQLNNRLKKHGFKSIIFKNPKAWFYSNYYDKTSVYAYAIVKKEQHFNKIDRHKIIKQNHNDPPKYTARQEIRKKLIKNEALYKISRSLFRLYCRLTHFLHVYPDFLIIGAAKCGTTSLYNYLEQHPNVGKSLTKQIHFFDRYYERGVSWYKVCFPFIWNKFFHKYIKQQKFVTGEATAHYMTHPLAAERAFKIVPSAKIIVMLRNPIDRAYSHYNMEYANNNEDLTFEEAIEKEEERIAGEIELMSNNKNNVGINYPHRAYLTSSRYVEQIIRWRKYYPKERFLIVSSEEFNNNTPKVYNDVLKFLGLPSFELTGYKKYKKRNYKKMNENTRQKLKEYFKPYNEKLYEYLGTKFNWD